MQSYKVKTISDIGFLWHCVERTVQCSIMPGYMTQWTCSHKVLEWYQTEVSCDIVLNELAIVVQCLVIWQHANMQPCSVLRLTWLSISRHIRGYTWHYVQRTAHCSKMPGIWNSQHAVMQYFERYQTEAARGIVFIVVRCLANMQSCSWDNILVMRLLLCYDPG